MMRRVCISVMMLGVLSEVSLSAAESAADSTTFEHRIGLDVRPGIPTRHHDFLRGANATGKPFGASLSTHLQYSFRFPSASRLGRILPSAYQGAGIAACTFPGHREIGTPVAFYIFQGAEVARLAENLTLDYEWNFGVSAGWRNDNLVVGTKVNAYINTALLLSWHPRPEWTFSLGADFAHFSNGDTTLPNVGVNTLGARISAVRSIGGAGSKAGGVAYGSRTGCGGVCEGAGFMDHVSLDVSLCGAWNAETLTYDGKEYRLDGRFGVLALHVNPLYSLTRNILVGPSIDIQYNEGCNLVGHVAGISPITDEIRFHRPPLSEQLAAGLSLRVEFMMPIFSVNLGIGHNIIYQGAELGGFYNLAVLKTFITRNLFLHTGLKICYTDVSNNLLLGLGWRF